MLVGVWLILIGLDQVTPPSVDIEKAMSLCLKLLKRASAQTWYRLPLAGSTAMSPMISPVRTSKPVSGLVATSGWSVGPTIGAVQVAPPSVERMTARWFCAALAGWLPVPICRLQLSTREPQ